MDSTVTLTGWGRIAPSSAELAEPSSVADVEALLETASPSRPLIPRGLGRSYNNAAQCGGGVVMSTAHLNPIIELDPVTGVADCAAGVSLEQLMVTGLPAGWFVPVSPGTRQVTIGGAIAADVHGKNHHVAGSFARHVRSFDLVLPGGELRTVTGESDPALFWATAGGMGLTGFIVRAAVQLKRVATSRVRVDTVRTADIDETMAVLAEHDRRYGYTVAWSDSMARGTGLGRSVVTSGDFAELADLPAAAKDDPFAFRPGARLGVPGPFPPGLINRYTVALANEAWYRKAPKHRRRGAADHRGVLPPAGRHQELEPGLRARRVPAVPVRPAVRPGSRGAPLVRAGQRGAGALVRDRAQAVRRGRPRAAVVSHGRLDAGARLPGADPGAGRPARCARPAGR